MAQVPSSNSITDQSIELFVPWIAKGEREKEVAASISPGAVLSERWPCRLRQRSELSFGGREFLWHVVL